VTILPKVGEVLTFVGRGLPFTVKVLVVDELEENAPVLVQSVKTPTRIWTHPANLERPVQ
jgi:hypothetical protein